MRFKQFLERAWLDDFNSVPSTFKTAIFGKIDYIEKSKSYLSTKIPLPHFEKKVKSNKVDS